MDMVIESNFVDEDNLLFYKFSIRLGEGLLIRSDLRIIRLVKLKLKKRYNIL